MFSTEVKGEWNGKQIDGAVEIDWADVAVTLNMSGFYEVIDNKHHLAASSELRMPSLAAWHQLKSSMEGTFSIEQNPSSFKVNIASCKLCLCTTQILIIRLLFSSFIFYLMRYESGMFFIMLKVYCYL